MPRVVTLAVEVNLLQDDRLVEVDAIEAETASLVFSASPMNQGPSHSRNVDEEPAHCSANQRLEMPPLAHVDGELAEMRLLFLNQLLRSDCLGLRVRAL